MCLVSLVSKRRISITVKFQKSKKNTPNFFYFPSNNHKTKKGLMCIDLTIDLFLFHGYQRKNKKL